jgi:hypothetical protein
MEQQITYPEPEDFEDGQGNIDWPAYYEAMESIDLEQNGIR